MRFDMLSYINRGPSRRRRQGFKPILERHLYRQAVDFGQPQYGVPVTKAS
jgi:hypothetical protein